MIVTQNGKGTPKSAAPTIDDIYYAIKEGRMRARRDIIEALMMAIDKKSGMQQFNFGVLSSKAISDASVDASSFVRAGAYTEPYPFCFYRASVQYDDEKQPIGQSYVVFRHKSEEGVAVVHLCHSDDHLIAVHSVNTLNVMEHPKDPTRLGVQVRVLEAEIKYWCEATNDPYGLKCTPEYMSEGAVTVMGLTMILNTKGIRKETTPPPRKPNMARERTGKPLLPYVTHVYTNVYMRAVKDGPKGTHASPRPHMRRAHVRTYRNEDGSVHHHKAIDAMLVNWDGTPLQRGQYEVDSNE